jgi:DNA-binding response OmpR family regulator
VLATLSASAKDYCEVLTKPIPPEILIERLQQLANRQDGYLSDSRDPNILWFQKSGLAKHLTRDL